MLLEGKTALVTGAGSGIGRSIVDRFVEEGATVGAIEISQERVDSLEEDFGSDVLAVQGDVTSLSDNEKAVDETVNAFGKLDILVGNAGIFDGFTQLNDLPGEKMVSAFDEQFHVNVLGYMMNAKAALPELRKTEGTIIYTASYASANPDGGGILYTASKHAVAGVIRQLSFELAPKIRVNGVAPGYVQTNLSNLESLDEDHRGGNEIDDPYPIENIMDPDVYGGYYAFLASDEVSPLTTGEIINADAGLGIRGIKRIAGGEHL